MHARKTLWLIPHGHTVNYHHTVVHSMSPLIWMHCMFQLQNKLLDEEDSSCWWVAQKYLDYVTGVQDKSFESLGTYYYPDATSISILLMSWCNCDKWHNLVTFTTIRIMQAQLNSHDPLQYYASYHHIREFHPMPTLKRIHQKCVNLFLASISTCKNGISYYRNWKINHLYSYIALVAYILLLFLKMLFTGSVYWYNNVSTLCLPSC
jgi:hypothetical protein